MPRAVFFDVGNTLLYPYPSVSEVVRRVLEDVGHVRDLDAIDTYMPLVDEYYEDRYREDDTFWRSEEGASGIWVGMYTLLSRKLGIEADAEVIARRVYDEFGSAKHWKAYPDVEPALERLRAQGITLGVISNWDSRLRGILDGLGLAESFATVVSSAEVALHKPDPRIFELACEHVGMAPRECAHVGDHLYADVLGAQTAGMTPVLIDRFEAPAPAESGVTFIRTFDELDGALGL